MVKGFSCIGTEKYLNILAGTTQIIKFIIIQNYFYILYFRRGNEYTDTYGSNSSIGILSPALVKCFHSSVRNCILDGEMMCYNTKLKSFTTKGNI